ncbi:BT_3987 domain-containing protein [Sphingobacterium sp. SYP-B4668]|uniref:BT_3987 domain-containing protein n=1 Tax=Sphingobacterium sp. SYP-B4668 TaxID=2996035 RepID=UPI0022DD18C9|nr:DUF1735 domain-containing protein [Sphingobacterium sp. SYP-B4668]
MMKRFLITFVPLIFAANITSCNKEVSVNLDIPEAEKYGNVYMPQANQNPILKQISLTDKVHDLSISAFLGGPHKADRSIVINFDVNQKAVEEFNLLHDQSYEILPTESYTFEKKQAVIPSGSSKTEQIKIQIMGKGILEPFTSYLLPVTITSTDASIKESLNTVYFEVVGSYAPGEVPREKVLSLGDYTGGVLFSFKDGKLISKSPDGNLALYASGEDGLYKKGNQIGTGFNAFTNLFYFQPNRIVGLNIDVVQYLVNDTGELGANRTIGWGWNIFKHVIPYQEFLIGVRPEGLTTSYPYNDAGDLDGGNIRDIATDWNRYKQIIAYHHSLLAIQPDGTLWHIPMSASGIPDTRQQVGTGWDMYKSVIVSGTDLLALDSSGDVWRYRFNPKGFWPLKPAE